MFRYVFREASIISHWFAETKLNYKPLSWRFERSSSVFNIGPSYPAAGCNCIPPSLVCLTPGPGKLLRKHNTEHSHLLHTSLHNSSHSSSGQRGGTSHSKVQPMPGFPYSCLKRAINTVLWSYWSWEGIYTRVCVARRAAAPQEAAAARGRSLSGSANLRRARPVTKQNQT